MFLAAALGWVWFRSANFTMALDLLHTMFVPRAGTLVQQPEVFAVILGVAAAIAMVGPNAFDLDQEWSTREPGRSPIRAGILAAAMGACLAIMAGSGSSPFLYFQF
jgi:hypothetical protein